MRRPRPGVWTELLPVALVLAATAGTLGLVITVHRRAEAVRLAARAPEPKVAAAPAPPPPTPPPTLVSPPPAPAPKKKAPATPAVDPTKAALAKLAAEEAEQLLAASEADRLAESREAARAAAARESDRWKRRETVIRSQLSGLESQAKTLEAQADALALERDLLAQERDAAKAAAVKDRSRAGGYAVLPHKGPNGTWQRPVVIECRDGEAVVQPKGTRFTLLDMSSLLGPRSSPLVMAVAQELIKIHRSSSPDGSPVVPYVYFLVRPDGIRAYYEARSRLEPLGIAFGYELADDDWQVEFPDFDALASWDGDLTPRKKDGQSLAGGSGAEGGAPTLTSGTGDFVWPVDRPNGGRTPGGTDNPYVWPTQAPGSGRANGVDDPGAAGPGGHRPGGFGTGTRGNDLAANPGTPSGGGFGTGGLGPKPEARPGSPSNGGSGYGGGPAEDARRNANAGGQGGLVPVGSGGLPGFDRVDATGSTGPNTTSPGGLAQGRSNGGSPGMLTGEGEAAANAGSSTTGAGYGLDMPTTADPGSAPGTAAGSPPVLLPDVAALAGSGGALPPPSANRPRMNLVPPSGPALAGNTPPGGYLRNQSGSGVTPPEGGQDGDATGVKPKPDWIRVDPAMLAQRDEDDEDDSPERPPAAPRNRPVSGLGSTASRGGASGGNDSPPLAFGPPSSSTSGSPSQGIGIGLPSLGTSDGDPSQSQSQGASPPVDLSATPDDIRPKPWKRESSRSDRPTSIQIPLELVVACGPDGAVVHPGGYRLSSKLLGQEGALVTDLKTIVRNHELVDPMIRPVPRLKFLVEPGGTETYQLARQKTVLSGLKWPVTTQAAGASAPTFLPKETF